MRYLPIAIIILLFAAAFTSGCKLDAPVYPVTVVPPVNEPDTVVIPDTDNGIDEPTDATYTIPIGAVNTIVFRIESGEIITLNAATAIVTKPESMTLTGYTSVLGSQDDPEIFFQLNFNAVSKGELVNDLLGIQQDVLKLSDDGNGKVKVTTFAKVNGSYHVRGYFNVLTTNDTDGTKHRVIGSFNIAQ